MVVAVVGPSHAGKTTLVQSLREANQDWCGSQLNVVELDQVLGDGRRSDGPAAIMYLQSLDRTSGRTLFLVDVGAGQMMAAEFRRYLLDSPDALRFIVVWCDRQTFVRRHSTETAARELENNFSPELQKVWDIGRANSRLVDTSSPTSVVESRDALARLVRRLWQSKGG